MKTVVKKIAYASIILLDSESEMFLEGFFCKKKKHSGFYPFSLKFFLFIYLFIFSFSSFKIILFISQPSHKYSFTLNIHSAPF